MTFHAKDDFKEGAPISQVPASWFNKVAKFINNLVGGFGIRVRKERNGLAVIELDKESMEFPQSDGATPPGSEIAPEDWANDSGTGLGEPRTTGLETVCPAAGSSAFVSRADHRHKSNLAPLGADSTYGGKALVDTSNDYGATGTLKYAARADHTHPMPSASDISYDSTSTVADKINTFVTLNTTQSITGRKNFLSDNLRVASTDTTAGGWMRIFGNALYIAPRGSSGCLINFYVPDTTGTSYPTDLIGQITVNSSTGNFTVQTNSAYGGNLILRALGSGKNVMISATGSEGQVILSAKGTGTTYADGVMLNAAPTDTTSTSTNNVATLGWVNDKFIRKPSSTGLIYWDASGKTVAVMAIGTESGTVAAGDHTHAASTITGLYAAILACLEEETSEGMTVIDSLIANYIGDSISDLEDTVAELPTTSDVQTAITEATQNLPTTSDVNTAISTATSGMLTSSAVGDTVQAHSAKLDALESALDSSGKVPLSQLTGNISGHSGNCLVTIDTNGTLGHSGNDDYNVLKQLTSQCDLTGDTPQFPFAEWASGATKAGVIVGTDSNGDLTNLATLPTTAAANFNKVVAVKAGSTDVTIDAVPLVAESPSSTQTISLNTGTSANSTSRTFSTSTTTGLKFPVVTSVVWTGSILKMYTRTLTFDKYGRLYNVSAEAATTIDTPSKVVWG